MHTKNDFILDKEFQKYLTKEHRKILFIDKGKYRKIDRNRKCTDREYHVQNNADIAHKDVKKYCNTNQFPELPFCGSHPKPHVARELSNDFRFVFDPKLGNEICAIYCIPCACGACTSMMYQPRIFDCCKKFVFKNTTKEQI